MLTLPLALAAITAGVAGGVHCIGMCGRISTYMLVGALFGGLGNAGLILRPYLPAQQFLFVFGNLALVALGIRVLGVTVPFQWLSHFFSTWQQRFFSKMPSLKNGIRYPFLTGLAWGCL